MTVKQPKNVVKVKDFTDGLTKEQLNAMHYNSNNLLSRGSFLNFIVGMRGGGKSYDFKRKSINRFLKTGQRFVYMRRYGSELKKFRYFFDDIRDEFPDHEITVKGKTVYIDGMDAGCAVALTSYQTDKSVDFTNVWIVGFDEFLIKITRYRNYLSNEIEALNEFLESIGRTKDFKVLFIGNAMSVVNPYFIEYKLQIDPNKKFQSFYNNLITVEIFYSEEFKKIKDNTKMGQLNRLVNPDYHEYNTANSFLADTNTFIEDRSKYSRLHAVAVIDGLTVGFWYDEFTGRMYASRKHNPNMKKYTIDTMDHDATTILIKSSRYSPLKGVVQAFKYSMLSFEDQEIKQKCYDFLARQMY